MAASTGRSSGSRARKRTMPPIGPGSEAMTNPLLAPDPQSPYIATDVLTPDPQLVDEKDEQDGTAVDRPKRKRRSRS
jgi:hypothetical protein